MATEENGHISKRSRSSNCGGRDAPKIVQRESGAVGKTAMAAASDLRQWQQPSSRIFRVSQASGGKDRHSKVFTSKGLRDRRVRLSVSTAIQFYDLQDRLGYDQPSKAIEWLIKAASSAIDELPLLRNSFPELPDADGEQKQLEAAMNAEADPVDHNPQLQQLSMSKSGCSSNSETSKGSVLSLSRPEIRVKKRERAHDRTAKDKEGSVGHLVPAEHPHDMSQSLMNARSSFTELLTDAACGGRNNIAAAGTATAVSAGAQSQHFQPSTVTADYFGQGGFFTRAAATQKIHTHQHPSSFSFPQAHFLNSSPPVGMVPYNISSAAAAAADGYNSEMQQFSLMQGYMDHNLNFSNAPGLAGFQRGTLQSNSSAHLTQQHHQHHLLRFSSTSSSSSSSMDGPNFTLAFGAAPPPLAAASTENYLHSEFDSRLQLSREPATPFFLDGYRHSDVDKGKGKR